MRGDWLALPPRLLPDPRERPCKHAGNTGFAPCLQLTLGRKARLSHRPRFLQVQALSNCPPDADWAIRIMAVDCPFVHLHKDPLHQGSPITLILRPRVLRIALLCRLSLGALDDGVASVSRVSLSRYRARLLTKSFRELEKYRGCLEALQGRCQQARQALHWFLHPHKVRIQAPIGWKRQLALDAQAATENTRHSGQQRRFRQKFDQPDVGLAP
jgi:hypothetical protein